MGDLTWSGKLVKASLRSHMELTAERRADANLARGGVGMCINCTFRTSLTGQRRPLPGFPIFRHQTTCSRVHPAMPKNKHGAYCASPPLTVSVTAGDTIPLP